MRLVALIGLCAACRTGTSALGEADAPVSAEVVQADVAAVRTAMEQAWGRGAVAPLEPSGWANFVTWLDEVPKRSHTARSLCDGIGDALLTLNDPSLAVIPAVGSQCGRIPAKAVTGTDGANVASGAETAWALLRTDEEIAVLGIRHFEPPGAAWAGFDAALKQVAKARALVVDLRSAEGEDPRGALPLLWALARDSELKPIRQIVTRDGELAERMRAAWRAQMVHSPSRDPAHWIALVGDEHFIRERRPDDVRVLVLLGGTCGGACELIARMLQDYSDATVTGRVAWYDRLAAADPGLLQLASGVRVYLPTTAYVLNLTQSWRYDRGVYEQGTLGAALGALREDLRWAEHERRWSTETPPPCDDFPAVEDRAALPDAVKQRFHITELSSRMQHFALLYLPEDAATAYVRRCTGLKVELVMPHHRYPHSTVAFLEASSYAALTRLAQSPVAARVYEEPRPVIVPTADLLQRAAR